MDKTTVQPTMVTEHHDSSNHEKACESTLKAHAHTALASDHQREVLKQHVK